MPTTWDLDDALGYFQLVVVLRKQRRLTRTMWNLVHRQPRAPKAGESDAEAEPLPGALGSDNRDGAGPGANGGGGTGAGAGGGGKGGGKAAGKPPSPYPVGKRLLPWEATRSLRLAPKDAEGKKLCWDFSTHAGCKQNAAQCTHSHRQIKTTAGLAWEVLVQLLRRGGLKTGPPIPAHEVDARIDQLRKQAKAEKDAKQQGGGGGGPDAPRPAAKGHGRGGQVGEVPDE